MHTSRGLQVRRRISDTNSPWPVGSTKGVIGIVHMTGSSMSAHTTIVYETALTDDLRFGFPVTEANKRRVKNRRDNWDHTGHHKYIALSNGPDQQLRMTDGQKVKGGCRTSGCCSIAREDGLTVVRRRSGEKELVMLRGDAGIVGRGFSVRSSTKWHGAL
jgi:hypothetical protein